MTTIITIANQKGGVGKTTTAVNLAHGLAEKGKSVLTLDLDPQGQVARSFGLEREDGFYRWIVARQPLPAVVRQPRPDLSKLLSIVPGDHTTGDVQGLWLVQQKPIDELRRVLAPYTRNGLNYILIDTSPSVGGLQERALYAADLIIVPCECKFLSADSVASTISAIDANVRMGWKGSLLGVLPTFFKERNTESAQTLKDLYELYGDQVLEPIHDATILATCAAEGKTIWELDGGSRSGSEYAQLLYQVLEH